MHRWGAEHTRDRTGRSWSAAALTALAWAVGLLVTGGILGTPYLVFGYHGPNLHLVLDSVDGCIALLAAYLLHGRFRRSRRLQDLLLAQGLVLLGVAGLGLSLLLSQVDVGPPRTVEVWLPVTIRTLAGVLILAAAVVGDRVTPRLTRVAQSAPWVLLVSLSLVLWAVRDRLPTALSSSPPSSAQRPVLDGHWLLFAMQALAALCFLAASLLFAAQAVRRRDELLRWLGPACALGGLARVNYVLFPSLYSDWVYTGDLLRTGCYSLLAVGALREIGQYWAAQARLAVLDDRRRLARELHDGVVQELGSIRADSHRIEGDELLRARVLAACDRALDEARAAVDALGRSPEEPLGFTLHRAARQMAERYGARVVVDVDDSIDVPPEQRHALVRITREAISNAIRHGDASCVRVRLERDEQWHRLVVEDDGSGFDPERVLASTGYGLVSMQERATALPGAFDLSSQPGEGTKVGVTW